MEGQGVLEAGEDCLQAQSVWAVYVSMQIAEHLGTCLCDDASALAHDLGRQSEAWRWRGKKNVSHYKSV